MSETVTAAVPAAEAKPQGATFGDYVERYFARLRGGELGALPAIVGLAVLVVAFSIARPRFFTAVNFANLFQQGAAVAIIAMGLVFVLLLGEIDLSAGFASGMCAAILAVLLTQQNWPWWLAILAALVLGAAIGTVLGFLVAVVGIPSFVVTLAAFLAFQGVNLLILKEGRNISVTENSVSRMRGIMSSSRWRNPLGSMNSPLSRMRTRCLVLAASSAATKDPPAPEPTTTTSVSRTR